MTLGEVWCGTVDRIQVTFFSKCLINRPYLSGNRISYLTLDLFKFQACNIQCAEVVGCASPKTILNS
jgi:hypothetical protein